MTLIDRSFREKIILVGVGSPRTSFDEIDSDLDELALLVGTAGADVVARVIQRRERPDPAYYLGKGKLQELIDLAYQVDADTVVFDEELAPAQARNLTAKLGRTAIDRTAVILDIFAQNATTPEGKAQVELALLRYRLPHLRGKGGSLSQQAGGIGTRGPGETKLETDRRRLIARMVKLKAELKTLSKTRRTQRRARARSEISVVSIVGYTNAGKSTLLNLLTDASVTADDRLFATLDPRVRKRRLSSGRTVLFSDTVGFVNKLPHQLVEAFRSTLEVISDSDLLIHLVDGSYQDCESKIEAVRKVLYEIESDEVPEMLVFNKADKLSDVQSMKLSDRFPTHLQISAKCGIGIDGLLGRVDGFLNAKVASGTTISS